MATLGLPETWQALGVALNRARGSRSLRALAADVGVTKTTVARWEAGSPVPLHHAEALDQALGGDGLIAEAIVLLGQERWTPQRSDVAVARHAHQWSAAYTGQVWIWIRPTPDNYGRQHRMTLDWGPWRHESTKLLGRNGLTLLTGKSAEENAVTLNVETDPDSYALFGVGEVLGRPTRDIRPDWNWR